MMAWEIINNTTQAVLGYECKYCDSPIMCLAFETNKRLHLDTKRSTCSNFMCEQHNKEHDLFDLMIGGESV